MVQRLAINGGSRTVPEGIGKPWPSPSIITDDDRRAVIEALNEAVLAHWSRHVELLEEDYDPRYIGELKKILDSMKNLIARSSLFIKSPEEHRKRERLQVSSIIHRAIEALKIDLEKKKIRMVKSYGDAWIYVDPVIVEAFINILHNAIKYSPEGGEVVIETEKLEDSILIKIRDQGPGIPDEYKEVIFERFRSDKRKFGMGLGLATAKYLVEANGGRIWVEDNIPRGSVFNIQLPRK